MEIWPFIVEFKDFVWYYLVAEREGKSCAV